MSPHHLNPFVMSIKINSKFRGNVKTYKSASYATVEVCNKKASVDDADLKSGDYGLSVICEIDGETCYATIIGEIDAMPFNAKIVRQVAQTDWKSDDGTKSVKAGTERFAAIVL